MSNKLAETCPRKLSAIIQGYEAETDSEDIVVENKQVEEWLAKNVMPGAREGLYPAEFNPDSPECRQCGYIQHCIPEPREITRATEIILTRATENWRQGQEIINEGVELTDRAYEVLVAHTNSTGVDRWRFNGLAICLEGGRLRINDLEKEA